MRAEALLTALTDRGVDAFLSVPDSLQAGLLSALDQRPDVLHVPVANEGDAVAVAAGLALGGRCPAVVLQNAGLGNAINPLSSLACTFGLPMLLLCGHRGAPGRADAAQHRLMGQATVPILEALGLPWATLEPGPWEPALERATHENRPFVLLVNTALSGPSRGERPSEARSEPVAVTRKPAFDPSRGRPMSRADALAAIVATATPGEVIVATTGHTSRQLFAEADRPGNFYMVGSMGCASALGLGLSLAQPARRVCVIDGDGALLMRLGNLATVGRHAPSTLTHVVLDNRVHASTGGQPTTAPGFDFAAVAAVAGYAPVLATGSTDALTAWRAAPGAQRPRFAQIDTHAADGGAWPRPHLPPEALRDRLMHHLGALPRGDEPSA